MPGSTPSQPTALREGERFILTRPTIDAAIFEIRFTEPAREVGSEDALRLRDAGRAAGLDLGEVQPTVAHNVVVSVGPEGAQATSPNPAHGWQLVDSARQLMVTLLPGTLTVQTSQYERWGITFRPVLAALLAEVEAALHPELRSRIGLRYVNRIADANARTAGEWLGKGGAGLLGPILAGPFAGRVQSSQQQLELVAERGRGTVLRHGCFQDPAMRRAFTYLIDIDAFDHTTERFTTTDSLEVAQQLNRVAATTFLNALTPEFASELGMTPVDPLNDEPEVTT